MAYVHQNKDMLSTPELRELLVRPKIPEVARQLLGGPPRYFGDSTFQAGSPGFGWHKDNRGEDRQNPNGIDWEGRYPIIRFGIYMQNHRTYAGGLAVRPGSHLPLDKPSGRALVLGNPVSVGSSAGDVVVWNLRITHSGNSPRYRYFGGFIPEHPRVKALMKRIQLPLGEQRMAAFFTLGLAGPHLTRFMQYLGTRDYAVASRAVSIWEPATIQWARDSGLVVLNPEADLATSDFSESNIH